MVSLLSKFGLSYYYPTNVVCTPNFTCTTELPCIGVGVTCNTTTSLIDKFVLYNFKSYKVLASDVNCFVGISSATFYNTIFDDNFLYDSSKIRLLHITNSTLPSISKIINPSIKELKVLLNSDYNGQIPLSYLLNLETFSILSNTSNDLINLSFTNDIINYKSFKYFQIISSVIPSFKNIGVEELIIQLGINFDGNFNSLSTFNNVSKLSLIQTKYSSSKSISYKFPIELNQMNTDNSTKLSNITINYKIEKPTTFIDFSNFNSQLLEITLDNIGENFHINRKFPFSRLPSTLKKFNLINCEQLTYLTNDSDVGSLDYSVFNGIESVNLYSNNFNDTLPTQFNGKNIGFLDLSKNKLRGTIDSSYCSVLLDVSNNQLHGTLPSCYSCYINIPQTLLSSKFVGNSNLNVTTSTPCTTIIPQIKIENNNTIIYGNDLGFGLDYISIIESYSIMNQWKVGTLSKSYYLENYTKQTNFTVIFISSPLVYYTLSTIQNPPFISSFSFTSLPNDLKIFIFKGSFFTYNSSDIIVEFDIGDRSSDGGGIPNKECIIIYSTFDEIKCSIINSFIELNSTSNSLSTIIKIISNPNLKIQFPIVIGDSSNVNITSSMVSLCFYGGTQTSGCNYFNGQGKCIGSNICSCNYGWIGPTCQQETHKIISVIPSNQNGGLVIITGEFGLYHLNLFVLLGNGTINDPEKQCSVQIVSSTEIRCICQKGIGKTILTVGQNNFNASIPYQYNAICSSDCNSLVDNNNYCNNLTGQCNCDSGKFQGLDCKTPFIQCQNDCNSLIDNNNHCNNVTGQCNCDSGKFQGLDCKIPFIPCQNDCNSILNQGVCNNSTGVCTCANDKWTIDSYCSIPNHFCSSITPAPSGIGGPITLYGWFGYKHDNLQITIGGLSCSSIQSSFDQINCTIPSNSGIQTVNITQNQLSWIGINKFQYYQVIKSCPNKCSNQGICNQKNGQCNCNNGYSGFDCSAAISQQQSISTTTTSTESTLEPLPITQSEIDKQTGTFSLNNQETKYKLYIQSLIEVDLNNNPIKTYDLQDKWINTESDDSTGTYLFKQNLSNDNNGYLISTIQEIKQTKEISFAGVDFKLESGSIKVSIEINNYTYSSNLNTLQLLFISSVNVSTSNENSNNCNDQSTKLQNINDSDLNYIKIEKNGKILMGRFVNSVISDNRPTLITSTNLNGEGNNSDSIIVALNLPHCINQCQIDPDFAVLVSPSFKSNCGSNDNSRKNWLLPVVIVIPVVFVSIIIVVIVTLSKKSMFLKIKIKEIKLKTRK
ncbi:hypothetical protein ACTA71_008038 [Dictyostelium dimigraforme]